MDFATVRIPVIFPVAVQKHFIPFQTVVVRTVDCVSLKKKRNKKCKVKCFRFQKKIQKGKSLGFEERQFKHQFTMG